MLGQVLLFMLEPITKASFVLNYFILKVTIQMIKYVVIQIIL